MSPQTVGRNDGHARAVPRETTHILRTSSISRTRKRLHKQPLHTEGCMYPWVVTRVAAWYQHATVHKASLPLPSTVRVPDPAFAARGTNQVVANLRPASPQSGEFSSLSNPHDTKDCRCETAPVAELAVRHYLMTKPDYRARNRRRWGVSEMKLKW